MDEQPINRYRNLYRVTKEARADLGDEFILRVGRESMLAWCSRSGLVPTEEPRAEIAEDFLRPDDDPVMRVSVRAY